ncbi:MAG: cytochrome c oxidase subunit II [Nitriliruptorales bacterium]
MRNARRRRRAFGATLFVLALATSACVENVTQTKVDEGRAPQDYLTPVGRFAVDVDRLWDLVFWGAIAIFVLVEALIVVAILRFRERPDEDDERLPKQVHGNPRLEALWTIIPAVILAAVAVPTVRTLFDLAEQPQDALRVNVIAHQWWWEYRYPDHEGLVTANILHIPAGRTVNLSLESVDVIHSLWVPKLAGKQDVVPGRTNFLKIHADEPGEYLGQCAEYCGLSHANMRTRVIAMPPDEFDAWAEANARPQEGEPEGELAQRGRDIFFTGACVGCHTIRGTDASATVGPDLTYFGDREWFAGTIFENTDENLREWLRDPPAMKPMMPDTGSGMPFLGLTEEEIDALVAYLQSLKTQPR